MKRDYTEEAYQQIKQTIEQIDNTDVSPVKDFFSDLLLRLGQFLEIFSVEQYQDDMQSWYDIVLDSHNTTMSTVDQVFNDVYAVDIGYKDIVNGVIDSIVSYQNTLNCLRDVISGKTSYEDAKAAAKGYLAAGKESFNSANEPILTKLEAQNLMEAYSELIGDTINLGLAFSGFVTALVSRDPLKAAVSVKKLSDAVTATVCDLAAMGKNLETELAIDVGSLFGIDQKDLIDYRFDNLIQAQKYKDTNSVSDFLDSLAEPMVENLEACPKDSPFYPIVKVVADVAQITSYTSHVADRAVDLYDIVSDVKDIEEAVLGKNYTVDEYVDKFEKKSWGSYYIDEIIDSNNGPILHVRDTPKGTIYKLISHTTGIPVSGWEDDPAQNVLKVIGTIWPYGERILPDPVTGRSNTDKLLDVTFGKARDTKFVKDVIDFAKDSAELAKDTADFVKDAVVSANESLGYANDPLAFKRDYLITEVN